jgi:hypothetical protein
MFAEITLTDTLANAINDARSFMSQDQRIHSMPIYVPFDIRATNGNGFDL